ncbi:MAG: hypothetical protein M9941_11355 [Anaerolineae bacterium]|nr:hypothetical protein [Anaerolineae bacterium]
MDMLAALVGGTLVTGLADAVIANHRAIRDQQWRRCPAGGCVYVGPPLSASTQGQGAFIVELAAPPSVQVASSDGL